MKNIIKTACLAFLLGDICSYAIATQQSTPAPKIEQPKAPSFISRLQPIPIPSFSFNNTGIMVKLSNVDTLPKPQFPKTKYSLSEISNRQLNDFPYTVCLDITGLVRSGVPNKKNRFSI